MSVPIDGRDPSAPDGAVSSLPTRVAPGGVRSGSADAGAAPAVTLIVPMFNERRRIRACLQSILAQDVPPDRVEILLVDGGSTDGTLEIVREMMAAHPGAAVRLIDNERRIPAAALNLGIRQARGAYILRLDAHCEAAPDFIRKTLEVLDRTGAACVGGCLTSVGEGRTGRAVALAMSSPFGVGNAHFRYLREERSVDAVAFGAYRREIFDEIGLYDEDLVYSEDNELNDRLTRTGRRVVLSPEIRVRYFTRETLGALWQQYFHYGFGRTRYAMRAPGSLRPRHVAPFALIGFLGAALLAGFLDTRFWLALIGVLGLWLLAAVAATLRIGIARGGDALPLVPLAFACQHFGYGLGQWAGLVSPRRSGRASSSAT
jgi:glycosyltransferase involved in cell wall biosynthesis